MEKMKIVARRSLQQTRSQPNDTTQRALEESQLDWFKNAYPAAPALPELLVEHLVTDMPVIDLTAVYRLGSVRRAEIPRSVQMLRTIVAANPAFVRASHSQQNPGKPWHVLPRRKTSPDDRSGRGRKTSAGCIRSWVENAESSEAQLHCTRAV